MVGQPLVAAFGEDPIPWRETVAESRQGGYRQEVDARRRAGATYLMRGAVGS